MPVVAVLNLLAAALYAGFQWTIRVVVYPQFARAGRTEFAGYEAAHQRLVSRAVGPLFAGLVAATAALVLHRPGSTPVWTVPAAVVLVAAILLVTAGLAVPQHRALSAGFDAAVHRRLLAVDTVRLVAALLDVAVALVVLFTA